MTFREEQVLKDGQKVVLRFIQPSDAAEVRRGFGALSPETRYRRFFGAITELDDAALEYLTNVDGNDHVAIVALVESLDLKSERGVGVARFVRSKSDPHVAEAAVVVVDDMQQLRLGTCLMQALVRLAGERGIDRFRAEVLESNEPVVRALLDAGAVVVDRDGGAVVMDVPLEREPIIRRALRVAAEQVNVFLKRLLPPRAG